MRHFALHRTVRRPTVADPLASAPAGLRETWSARLAGVAAVLGRLAPGALPRTPDLVKSLELAADLKDRSHVWLALAALSGTFPDERAVVDVGRACELGGGGALWAEVARSTTPASARLPVQIVAGQTLVDVSHTVENDLATGIQRVAFATASRWLVTTSCIPVAWTAEFGSLRELTTVERARLG